MAAGSGRRSVPCSILLGWEYECGRGCRFFLSPEHLKPPADEQQQQQQTRPRNSGGKARQAGGGVGGEQQEQQPAGDLLLRNLPLFLDCPACSRGRFKNDDPETMDGPSADADSHHHPHQQQARPSALAQLSRFYCVTPPAPLRLSCRPVVHFSGPAPAPAAGHTATPGPSPGLSLVPQGLTINPKTQGRGIADSPGAAEGDLEPTPSVVAAAPGEGGDGQGQEALPLHHQAAIKGPLPPDGLPACLSFAPSCPQGLQLPEDSLVVLRFPAAFGLPAGSAGAADRPLLQSGVSQPYMAWLEGGSTLFPA